ncbi:MAG: GHKL domain-containing protein [Proteobacteria bacterium]|nr:GHKL domain-containing protein [Pseudomonadota bacterium]
MQGKVFLILIAVIFPISVFLGLAQSKVMEPVLYEEIRQVGVSFAQNLASQIESEKLLRNPNASNLIEDKIQRMLYSQPGVVRVDIISKRPKDGSLYYLASSIEEQEAATPPADALQEHVSANVQNEEGVPVWSITYPIRSPAEPSVVHLLISLGFVSTFQSTILKINVIAAILSTIVLILVLSFLLRRAIENERQLRVAQESNAVLSGKLQEIQQALIHTEKLAVMGQLTASFAHEIGTPLNAVGGHLQLLKMGLQKTLQGEVLQSTSDRIGIIAGQLKKIEDIVKGFLATTKKPIAQQKVAIPVNDLVRNVVALVHPTLQVNGIVYVGELLEKRATVEVVPLEIEQVLLNLVNNAIYSMKEKGKNENAKNQLRIRTYSSGDAKTVIVEIKDTGLGISEQNLKQIFKPFFTTKPSGEGHGLGLSICQQIIHSYGGEVRVDSKMGEWTRFKVQLPLRQKT